MSDNVIEATVTRMSPQEVAADNQTVALVADPGQPGVHILEGAKLEGLRSHFGTAAAIGGGIGAMAIAKNRLDNMSPDAGMGERLMVGAMGVGGLVSTGVGLNDALEKKTGQGIGKWTQKILEEGKNAAQNLGR